MSNNTWSNRFAFIITTSAFSVGIGNIWRFPYITGENGGGAFLLVYLVLVLLIGIPLMTIEMGLGRLSGTTPLLGFGKIVKKPAWNAVGWLEVLTCLFIMSYYVMIMAWIAIYCWESLSGGLSGITSTELPNHFSGITSNSPKVILVILGILLLTFGIVRQGLQAGLERYSKIMMLGLILIILGLAIWSTSLSGAMEGYRWYLTPDFSKINLQTALIALGQIFFSIGIGMAAAFAFGSYTNKQEDLISSAGWIVLMDTLFAVLAGFMIFPAIFTYGLAPDAGENLVFVTMTAVFGKIAFGKWMGAIFFLLLFLAGFTSLMTSVQALQDSFREKFNISPLMALFVTILMIGIGSIPSVFSYAESPFQVGGLTFYEMMDYLTNTIMLPFTGLMIAIFAAYVLGFKKIAEHLNASSKSIQIGAFWKIVVQWILPIALLIIFLKGFF